MLSVAVGLTIILLSFAAGAAKNCELIASEAASVYAYCPPETTPQQMAASAVSMGNKHFNQRQNQIHIYFFSNKKKTPKTGSGFAKMSDADVDRYQTGIYDDNRNTNYLAFVCRKEHGKKLEKCESFLK